MKYAWLPLFALFIPAFVFAEPMLPTGGVACLSLKDAKAYANYVKQAPKFAADLLARANCYEVKETVPAVKKGRITEGFQAYTLLSGHKVWLPAAK